ncbi:hypothetical protein M3D75_02925 [Microbacterium enclense]|uniref:hypothetical protein n=1 Tax=Microbacterium enclense TaxID=993073 RepID=UPI0021A90FF8|nr:hypothetical protein [Microbacterium enclense]MCT2085060.1 hypothetical protein [Microbacterium enclense]
MLELSEPSAQLFGRPVYPNEDLAFGEVIVGDFEFANVGREYVVEGVQSPHPILRAIRQARESFYRPNLAIWMHLHTLHAFRISLTEGRNISDPSVQLEASLAWIRDRTEDAAARTIRNLDRMVQRYADRDQDREDARALLAAHPDCAHAWWIIVLPWVVECARCRVTVTVEAASYLGLVIA